MFAFRRISSLRRLGAIDNGTVELSPWHRAERLPLETPAAAHAVHATCTCAMAHAAGVYNEEAFHYLLTVEYKRFARSHRPFVLALIEDAAVAPEPRPMRPAVSTRVFAALAHSLRETDVVGWYREGRVVGAVLTHLGDRPLAEVSRLMSGKIDQALHDDASRRGVERLDVKIYQPFEESWS